MSKKMLLYSVLILLISNLLYHEYWGLNAFIISIVFVLVSGIHKIKNLRREIGRKNVHPSSKWGFAALLFIANGFALFYMGSGLSGWLYILSFAFFVGIHNQIQLSLPLGFTQTLQSFILGFYHFFEFIGENIKQSKKANTNKHLVRFLIYSIPVVIAIVFLKLYQNADATFYEWTKFINLDWISWGFIGFYFILFIALFGLFYFQENKDINELESSLKNDIPADYTDKVQTFMGVSNEKKIALSLFITLNLMLLLYTAIDLKFILVDLPTPSPTLRYSELIHGGINSLIISIVLVIVIITFFYRGQLNFQGNKAIRFLAISWLFLNLLMVGTTMVKNVEYIAHWGLTYKRIGVYIYLFLAAVGLVFTIVKIARIKSFWFLMRNTSLAFLTCFTIIGMVNWNKIIVTFNLTQLKTSQIDFDYLHSLGKDTYPDLMYYYNANKKEVHITEDRRLWHGLFESFDKTRNYMRYKKSNSTWRSINLHEQELLRSMNRFKLVYTPNPSR